MARITVEDCLKNIPNRFDLIVIASKRARQLMLHEKETLLEDCKDEPTVAALREIAEGYIDNSILEDEYEDSFFQPAEPFSV